MQAVWICVQLQKTYGPLEEARRSHDIQYKATHKAVALALYKESRKILKTKIPRLIPTRTFLNVVEHIAALSFLGLPKS